MVDAGLRRVEIGSPSEVGGGGGEGRGWKPNFPSLINETKKTKETIIYRETRVKEKERERGREDRNERGMRVLCPRFARAEGLNVIRQVGF